MKCKEIGVGAVVLVLWIGLFSFLYNNGSTKQRESYIIMAYFDRSDGLSVGSEVRLSGVPVGYVLRQQLNSDYKVVVTLRINASTQITSDSMAIIRSDSLLGPKFIEVLQGGSERFLAANEIITYTQSALLMDDLLEYLLFRIKSKKAD